MPITFTGPSGGAWSLGAVIAIVVLVLCIVLAVVAPALTPLLVLGLIGALALARLT